MAGREAASREDCLDIGAGESSTMSVSSSSLHEGVIRGVGDVISMLVQNGAL